MNLDNIDSSQLPNLLYLALLLILLFVGFVFNNKLKISDLFKQIALWSLIVFATLIAYSFRFELYKIKERVIAELFPGKIMQISDNKIAIAISNDGHFYINIIMNHQPVNFMIDTGASDIALNLSDAKKIGIDVNNLSSFRRYQTANGSIMSGLTQVKEVELAGIKFYNVPASVNNSNMGTSLLGMSFLKRFKKYEFYQDRLVLTY